MLLLDIASLSYIESLKNTVLLSPPELNEEKD